MLSEATDRNPVRAQNPMSTHPPTKVSESLPCPRCESTSTKFCYYNNYNLSQPRHFCKSCRRYWTQGGTLRNIPVGGGTRKNSKRTRFASGSASAAANSLSCSSTVTHERVGPPAAFPCGGNPEMTTDVNLNGSVNVPGSGSFTNMLNMEIRGQNFLGLGGFHGYGIGSGLEELELGSGCSTWQLMNEDDHHRGSNGGGGGEDCFGWSGLAISSTPVKIHQRKKPWF